MISLTILSPRVLLVPVDCFIFRSSVVTVSQGHSLSNLTYLDALVLTSENDAFSFTLGAETGAFYALEISCHPGVATMTLAEATRARSTATYTVEAALDNLLSGFGAGGT